MLTLHPKRRSLPLVILITVATLQTMAQPLPPDPAVRTGRQVCIMANCHKAHMHFIFNFPVRPVM